jgi:uncharacterized membrane protein
LKIYPSFTHIFLILPEATFAFGYSRARPSSKRISTAAAEGKRRGKRRKGKSASNFSPQPQAREATGEARLEKARDAQVKIRTTVEVRVFILI